MLDFQINSLTVFGTTPHLFFPLKTYSSCPINMSSGHYPHTKAKPIAKQLKKMVPKSVGMLKRNIHWIFNEINKLSADAPHAVEEEDEAVPVALRARIGKFYSFFFPHFLFTKLFFFLNF